MREQLCPVGLRLRIDRRFGNASSITKTRLHSLERCEVFAKMVTFLRY